MTVQKAIKLFDEYHGNETTQSEYFEMLKTLRKAAENQVPKKPHKIHDMNVNGHPYYECVCNDCEYVLDAFKDDFCPNCGQAIDW